MSDPKQEAVRLLDQELAAVRRKLRKLGPAPQVRIDGLRSVLDQHAHVVAAIERRRRAAQRPVPDE
jgi:hypothetical protein